jgi:hypothetical protein
LACSRRYSSRNTLQAGKSAKTAKKPAAMAGFSLFSIVHTAHRKKVQQHGRRHP